MTETAIDTGKGKKPLPQLTGATSDGEPPRHRPTRKPFGSQEQKLAWPVEEGFRHYWFNDIPGRVARALEAGYVHVENVEGKKVQTVVGVSMDGKPLDAFLMKIPQEWYEEDMKAQQAKVDESDRSIRRGDITGKNLTAQDKDEHFYVGKQGISIKDETRPAIRR